MNYQPMYAQQPMMMGQQPMMMAPQQPLIWPDGIFITDRQVDDPNGCSCPPCYCLNRPVWFASEAWKRYGKGTTQQIKCCGGWEIKDGDVLGQTMTFEGKECCGIDSICEPEIHISQNGQKIGRAVMLCPCQCAFGEVDMCRVEDARGNPKYVRRENMCCPEVRHWSGDCCGWQQYRWPIHPHGAQINKSSPFAHITYKFHCCTCCHPIAVGIDANDMRSMNVPPEDQKLLVGMALCRWWRTEQEQQNNNNNGGA